MAMTVERAGSGRWRAAQADVVMVPTDGRPGPVRAASTSYFDFELRSLSRHDEVFSLMEVLVHPALPRVT